MNDVDSRRRLSSHLQRLAFIFAICLAFFFCVGESAFAAKEETLPAKEKLSAVEGDKENLELVQPEEEEPLEEEKEESLEGTAAEPKLEAVPEEEGEEVLDTPSSEKNETEASTPEAKPAEEASSQPAPTEEQPVADPEEKKEEVAAEPKEEEAPKVINTVTDPETGVITQTVEKKIEGSDTKIAVISDVHILPEEMIKDTEDFAIHKNSDRKYFEESVGLLEGAIQIIEKNGSTIMFITGDLTKDGEYLAHQKLAEILTKWVEAGKAKGESRRVFLVPGNHDINNQHGVDFNTKDGKAVPAKRTNPDEFMKNYEKLVYGQAEGKYKDSKYFKDYLQAVNKQYGRTDAKYNSYAHGYVSYYGRIKDKGITVIGLDTAIYSADKTPDHKDGHQVTNGTVTAAEMSWIADIADEARQRGDSVMLLCHHAFLPTFFKQEVILSPYIISNWNVPFVSDDPRIDGKTPGEVLASLGIGYLFTGHLHANDIARATYNDGSQLHQIQTGATVTYPMPVRLMDVKRTVKDGKINTEVDIKTQFVHEFTYTDHKSGKKVTINLDEHPVDKYGSQGLITEDMVATLADSYVGGYLKQLDLGELVPENLGETVLGLAKGYLGCDEEGKFTKTVKGFVTVKGQFHTQDGKTVLDLEVPGFGTAGPYRVEAEKLDKFIADLLEQLQTQALTDENIKAALSELSKKLLNVKVAEVEEGGTTVSKTLKDLANTAYGSYLAGDEKQPAWMKEFINKYQAPNQDLPKDLLNDEGVSASINELLDQFLEKVVYRNPETKEGDVWSLTRYLLGVGDEVKPDIVMSAIPMVLGQNNLKECFHNKTVNDLLKKVLKLEGKGEVTGIDLVNYILGMDAVKSKVSVPALGINSYDDLTPAAISFLDGLSREDIPSYAYQYLEDNQTVIAKQMNVPTYTIITQPEEPEQPVQPDQPGQQLPEKPNHTEQPLPGKTDQPAAQEKPVQPGPKQDEGLKDGKNTKKEKLAAAKKTAAATSPKTGDNLYHTVAVAAAAMLAFFYLRRKEEYEEREAA